MERSLQARFLIPLAVSLGFGILYRGPMALTPGVAMFRVIALPLDGSPFGERALPLAALLARRAGAELRLVHVHADEVPTEFVLGLPSMDWVDEEVREREEAYLREAVARAEVWGARASPVVLDGRPADALADWVEESGVELVVMSTHGRGGASRAWLGSVADRMVRHSRVPVLLLRAEEEEAPDPADAELFDHVLVPLDGSALAEAVLEPALALAELAGARCTLLGVVPPSLEVGGYVFYLEDAQQRQASETARAYLERVAARAAERVPTTVRTVVDPEPAPAIVRAARAEGADLIAISTHGRGGLSRLLLGSVADKVLRSATTPLLVYRPEDAEEARP